MIKKFSKLEALNKLLSDPGTEIYDTLEGCLIDNVIVCNSSGYCFFFEHAVNCWSSCYTVLIPEDQEDLEAAFNEWDKIKEDMEKMQAEYDIVNNKELKKIIDKTGGWRERAVINSSDARATLIEWGPDHKVFNIYSMSLDAGFDYDDVTKKICG